MSEEGRGVAESIADDGRVVEVARRIAEGDQAASALVEDPEVLRRVLIRLLEAVAANGSSSAVLQRFLAGPLVDTAVLPEGAVAWLLRNGRNVYPAGDGRYCAADEGGWIDDVRDSVDAWLAP